MNFGNHVLTNCFLGSCFQCLRHCDEKNGIMGLWQSTIYIIIRKSVTNVRKYIEIKYTQISAMGKMF